MIGILACILLVLMFLLFIYISVRTDIFIYKRAFGLEVQRKLTRKDKEKDKTNETK